MPRTGGHGMGRTTMAEWEEVSEWCGREWIRSARGGQRVIRYWVAWVVYNHRDFMTAAEMSDRLKDRAPSRISIGANRIAGIMRTLLVKGLVEEGPMDGNLKTYRMVE